MASSPRGLASLLLRPEEGPLPLEPSVVFGRKAPLAVEVGFGNGEALAWWARRRPDWNLLGIERPPECLQRAAARLDREGLGHVRLLQGDARVLLREVLPPASVRKVLMQFPMPWPKERHAKHRVAGPAFAATLAAVLEPGGHFELVTDQGWYADEAAAALEAAGAFRILTRETDPERPFRTRYESRWLQEGRSIHRLEVELVRPRPVQRRFLPRPMDHVFLSRMPEARLLAGLAGISFRETDPAGVRLLGVVKEVHARLGADGDYLLRVLAADGDFAQMFHLRLEARGEKGLLKVDGHPRPFHTPAVAFLVRALARRLEGEDPAGPRRD